MLCSILGKGSVLISLKSLGFCFITIGLLFLESHAQGQLNFGMLNKAQVDVDALGANTACTFVQQETGSGSGLTLAATFDRNTTAGNYILVLANWAVTASTFTLSSISDTQTNAYTLLNPSTYATNANTTHFKQIASEVAYAGPIVGGANTVTLHFSGATTKNAIQIYEVTPVTLDQTAATTGAASLPSAGLVTTTSAGECAVLAVTADATINNVNGDNGWIQSQTTGSANFERATGYQMKAAAGALTGNLYTTTPAFWTASMATFAPSGSTGSSGSAATHATSISWNHTVSGINRLLVVSVSAGAAAYSGVEGATITASYNGTGMTSLGTVHTGGWDQAFIQDFYLLNPTTGTHAVSVTVAGSHGEDLEGNSISFKNVNQTTPFQNLTFGLTPNVVASSNVAPTTPGNLIFDSISNGSAILTPNSGVTLQSITNLNGLTGGGNLALSTARGSGTVTTGYTSIQDDYGLIDFDVVAATNQIPAPAAPTKLVFSYPPPATFEYGICYSMIVQSQTAAGVPTSVTTPTVLTPTGTGMTFYSDYQCSTSIVTTTLPAYYSSTIIYFKATQNNKVLTVAGGGLTSATQTELLDGTALSGGGNLVGNGWYLVQSGGPNQFGTKTSSPRTFNQATVAGGVVLVECSVGNLGTLSVSDNGGNAYTASPIGAFVNAGSTEEFFYVANNANPGATALTYNDTIGTNSISCNYAEFIDTTGPGAALDTSNGTGGTNASEDRQNGVTAGANTNIPGAMTVKMTAAGDLIVMYASTCDNNFTWNAPLAAANSITNATGGVFILGVASPAAATQAVSVKEVTNGCSWTIQAISFKP